MGSISKAAGASVAKGNRRNLRSMSAPEVPPTKGDFTIPVAPLEEERAPAPVISLGKRQTRKPYLRK